MEPTATRRPLTDVPLRRRLERNFRLRHRLDRYRAGRHLDDDEAVDPDGLAAAMAAELDRPIDALPVASAGAARAARSIAAPLRAPPRPGRFGSARLTWRGSTRGWGGQPAVHLRQDATRHCDD